MAKEEWRPIPGWEGGYEASSRGRIKSVARRVAANPRGHGLTWIERRQKILPGFLSSRGYLCVTLSYAGKRETMVMIAHLVAAAFHGPRPQGLMVCHNNGKHSDNRASNLRYGTGKSNGEDSVKHGVMVNGADHYRAKLTAKDVRYIRAVYKKGAGRWGKKKVTQRDLMEKYGIGRSTLEHILAGRTWKDV